MRRTGLLLIVGVFNHNIFFSVIAWKKKLNVELREGAELQSSSRKKRYKLVNKWVWIGWLNTRTSSYINLTIFTYPEKMYIQKLVLFNIIYQPIISCIMDFETLLRKNINDDLILKAYEVNGLAVDPYSFKIFQILKNYFSTRYSIKIQKIKLIIPSWNSSKWIKYEYRKSLWSLILNIIWIDNYFLESMIRNIPKNNSASNLVMKK